MDNKTFAALTEIQQRVVKVVAEQGGWNRDNHLVQMAATCETLGLDSLDEVEVVMALEEEFEIEISDAEGEILRLNDLQYIAAFCEARAKGETVPDPQIRPIKPEKPKMKKAKKSAPKATQNKSDLPTELKPYSRPHAKSLIIEDVVGSNQTRKKNFVYQARKNGIALFDVKANRDIAFVEIVLSAAFNGYNLFVHPHQKSADLLLLSVNLFSESRLLVETHLSEILESHADTHLQDFGSAEWVAWKFANNLGFLKPIQEALINLRAKPERSLEEIQSIVGYPIYESTYDYYRLVKNQAAQDMEILEDYQESNRKFIHEVPYFDTPKKCTPVEPAPASVEKTSGMKRREEKEDADYLAKMFEDCNKFDILNNQTTHDLLRLNAFVGNTLDMKHYGNDILELRNYCLDDLMRQTWTALDGAANQLNIRPFTAKQNG